MTEVNDDGTVACYGGSLNHTISDYMLAQYQVTGKDMYYNSETGLSSFNDPVNVNALQREYNAEVVEKIWYPLVSYRTDKINVQDNFSSGKIASSVANNLFRFLNDTENYPVDFITGCAPFPVEEKGQTNYCSGVGYFSHAGVMSNAKDQEAAWAFLKYYATYGCKWLIAAGHAPTWKGTRPAASWTWPSAARRRPSSWWISRASPAASPTPPTPVTWTPRWWPPPSWAASSASMPWAL